MGIGTTETESSKLMPRLDLLLVLDTSSCCSGMYLSGEVSFGDVGDFSAGLDGDDREE